MSARSPTVHLLSPDAHALWAEAYDRDPNPVLALEERVTGSELSDLTGGAVLDVACGTGRWLSKLAEKGAACTIGVDLSAAMLAQAAARSGLAGRLVRADCMKLPVADSVVDAAVCAFAASHLADLGGFARELARVVEPGGRLLVSDLHPSARERGWKRRFRHNGETIEVAAFDYGIEVVSAALTAAGFDEERRMEPHFGEPERFIFERAGRGASFEALCRQPAIYVCRFTRRALAGRRRAGC